MIKLTRGALTMLLAQYRGILKNAWIKNFAVAAALATTVTTAYADPAKEVTTWDDAVKTGEGAVALDGTAGVLNIQTTAGWKENPGTITITGGDGHMIGGKENTDVVIFAEEENSEKAPVGSIVIDTTGGASAAKLTIANNQAEGTKSKTGVRIYSVDVKAGSVDSDKTANLTVSTKPDFGPDYKDDEEQYVNIEKLTVDGAKASVNVTKGELDVNELLTIKNGAKVEVAPDGDLWVGNSDVDAASVNVEDGTLTSTGYLYIDSSRLKVGEKGQVNVSKFLSLADVGPVNINTLTKLASDTESKAKITLTDATAFEGKDLILNKKIADGEKNYVSSLSGLKVTLGDDKYENKGLVKEVNVGSELTAKAGKDGKAATYQIIAGETINLDTSVDVDDGLYANKSGVGTVHSDLEVKSGALNVEEGSWTAQGLTLTEGTATVKGNAALALKALNIAAGNKLTVEANGTLDLAALTNGTDGAKGTIDNSGVVNIAGKTLAGAIGEKGYTFDNKDDAKIQVAGDATLATGAFLEDTSKSGIRNAGTLVVNGALTINGEKDKASELKNAGKITASSLTLKGMDYDKSKDEETNNKALFTLADGVYDIAGAVSTGSDLKIVNGVTVNAQSLVAHTIDVGGTVGSKTKPLTSIKAGGEFTSLAGSEVFAGTISADELVKLEDGKVTADSLKAKGDLTVVKGNHTFGDVTAANIKVDDGTIDVSGALNTGKFNQVAGTVTVTDGSFTAKETTAAGLTLKGASTANLGALTATTAGGLILQDTATATVKSYAGKVGSTEAVAGSVVIGQGTTLTVSDSLANNSDGTAIVVQGTLDVSTSVLGLKAASAKDTYETDVDFADASLAGILKINDANKVFEEGTINKDQLKGLKDALSHGDAAAAFNGKLSLTGVSADLGVAQKTTDAMNGSYAFEEVKDFASLTGDTTLNSTTIDVGNGATGVSGEFGNLIADAASSAGNLVSVKITDTTLQGTGTDITGNNYISAVKGTSGEDKNQVVVAGAELDDGSSLTLAGQGKIGAVTAESSEVGTLNVTGNAQVVGLDGKDADIGTSTAAVGAVNVSGVLTAKDIFTKALETSGSVVAANIEAGTATVDGGVVNATKLKATSASEASTIKAGSVNVGEAEFAGALTMEGGVVNAKEVTLNGITTIKGNANLIAGDLDAIANNITVGEDGDEGSAGFLFAKNIKSAGKIVVDPEFSQGVALAGTAAFNNTNELTTNIEVGQNAIFAYDENLTAEQLKSLASKYTLSDAENGVGSLLVVNSAIDLNNKGINVGKDQAAPSSPAPTNGKLLLGQNAALAVGGTALANANLANATPKAAVTATSGVEYDKTSKVLLDGGVKAGAQYQIFNGGNVVPNTSSTGAQLTVSSLNGFYTATIDRDGKTTKVAANRSVLSQLTTPLYEHLLAVTGNGNKGAGVQFLEKVASESLDGGKDAETVARLGAFGGLYNAAYNVNKTSADAIAARTAMGNNGVQQVATNNAIGGAVWLSPIYKNVKADSLESDGKESGADVKLTGVALGADVTTANNVRLGAMFNLGSGDTDGNKLGSRAENDFDYFGFGVYAAYNYGNFGVAADATYAKVDNDLSASSSLGYGYFKSSVDTNVYSLGLTAKYAFDTNFATITPHAGIRYTSLNADSYDVESAYGTLATTSYDSASVVSFPVGVTFTKDIKVNAWKVQPTFDVTLTANAGDTEAEYDTYFTGADSKVKLESEFVDSFTYGLTAGFEAQHESGVALGLGVNYEGSSNTNSYGVTGNVRYTF